MVGGVTPIIFPLREKLFTSALFLQQRPRSTGGRQVIVLPVMPWVNGSRPGAANYGRVNIAPILNLNAWPGFGLCATGVRAVPLAALKQAPLRPNFGMKFMPDVVHALKPMPATFWQIVGKTRDSAGAILGSCVVQLFRTSNDMIVGDAVSNADGNYYVKGAVPNVDHYIVAYKAGAPDLAGTTLNTLRP